MRSLDGITNSMEMTLSKLRELVQLLKRKLEPLARIKDATLTSSTGILNEPRANSFPALNAKQDTKQRGGAATCEGQPLVTPLCASERPGFQIIS